MKIVFKGVLILVLMSVGYHPSFAQKVTVTTGMAKVEPYRMEVTYNKTSHLIFPSAIRYVDLGSEYLIAGKADDAENVLRVKATVREFAEETNFSVITQDGRFYNFNVFYNANPATLNYTLAATDQVPEGQGANDVVFGELGNSSPSTTDLIMETIFNRGKRVITHIGSKSYGIRFLLRGIYVHNGKYYFHTELKNRSNVPFSIDFVSFKIVDKKVVKRTVVQEKPLIPLRIFQPLEEIAGNMDEQNVFLLDQFTLAEGKVLIIEIFEKNGGRQQVLRIKNSDLVNARLVKKILKI